MYIMMDLKDLPNILMMLPDSNSQFTLLDYFQILVLVLDVSIMGFKMVHSQFLFPVDVFVKWKRHHILQMELSTVLDHVI